MSSPVGSCGGSKSFDAVGALLRLLGFSGSAFSTSSDGGSGSAVGGGSAGDASPSVIGRNLADDARRFHVRVVRKAAWSFLGSRVGRSNRIKGWREVAEEAFSSDRDRRITWERINFWTVDVKSKRRQDWNLG
jgi:hypothetical protein